MKFNGKRDSINSNVIAQESTSGYTMNQIVSHSLSLKFNGKNKTMPK